MRHLFPTRLFEDTVQCSRRQIIAWLSRDGHPTGLCRVFELTVTAAGGMEIPTVILQFAEDFCNFHSTSIPQCAATIEGGRHEKASWRLPTVLGGRVRIGRDKPSSAGVSIRYKVFAVPLCGLHPGYPK